MSRALLPTVLIQPELLPLGKKIIKEKQCHCATLYCVCLASILVFLFSTRFFFWSRIKLLTKLLANKRLEELLLRRAIENLHLQRLLRNMRQCCGSTMSSSTESCTALHLSWPSVTSWKSVKRSLHSYVNRDSTVVTLTPFSINLSGTGRGKAAPQMGQGLLLKEV